MCSAIGSGRSIKVCERFGLDGARLLATVTLVLTRWELGCYSTTSYHEKIPNKDKGEMTLAFYYVVMKFVCRQTDMQEKGGKPARLLRAVQVV